MTYFIFIESDTLGVPHMEPLFAESRDDLAVLARRLLADHGSGIAAHVFEGDERILSIQAETRSAA